ncbi:hypothetical protein EON79_08510, partial [bacterium]
MVGTVELEVVGAVAGVAAIGVPVYAVAKGTALAVQRMQADYQTAQQEFEARQVRLANELEALRAAHAARRAGALGMGTQVDAGGVTGDTAGFLVRAVEDCAARAAARGTEEVARAAEALRARAARGETTILSELDDLYERLDSAYVQKVPTDDGWSQLLEAARSDLASPLFETAFRDDMAREIAMLAGLSRGEREVAMQGLKMVRSRLRRVSRERLEDMRVRAERAQRYRALVGESMGYYRAVAGTVELPAYQAKARAGLVVLREALVASDDPEARLRSIAIDAKALYDEAIQVLMSRDATEAVCEKIGDVLLGMGYSVSSLDPEEGTGRHIVLADDRGLSISVDPKGRVLAEMVAYGDHAAVPDAADEENVCRLVDELFATMKAAQLPVRERTRKRLKKHE